MRQATRGSCAMLAFAIFVLGVIGHIYFRVKAAREVMRENGGGFVDAAGWRWFFAKSGKAGRYRDYAILAVVLGLVGCFLALGASVTGHR